MLCLREQVASETAFGREVVDRATVCSRGDLTEETAALSSPERHPAFRRAKNDNAEHQGENNGGRVCKKI